jgi:AcrR family transcriptional regulator
VASEQEVPSFEHSPFVLAPQQERSRAALRMIVTAAATVIVEKGLEGFSMADVAAESGIPVASIYRRFRGKADLILAIKGDATSRIETAVAHRCGGLTFTDIHHLVSTYALATAQAFAKDEVLHRFLFSQSVGSSRLDEIGNEGRLRVFDQYRAALNPLLQGVARQRRDLLVQVSFQIIASALLTKARGVNAGLNALSWNAVAREFGRAAASYLAIEVR